jgi:hypothetical protein
VVIGGIDEFLFKVVVIKEFKHCFSLRLPLSERLQLLDLELSGSNGR